MNPTSTEAKSRLNHFIVLICAILAVPGEKAAAQSQYFTTVTNGVTYSWDSANWSATNSSTAPYTNFWVPGAFARFYNGSAGTNYTVTVNASEQMTGLYNNTSATNTIQDAGNGTGSLNVINGIQGFLSIGTTIITCPIVGTGGVAPESTGNVELFGTNTYTGGTALGDSGNTLTYFNSSNSFGTGPITLNRTGNFSTLLSTGTSTITIPNSFSNVVGNTGPLTELNFASGSTAPVVSSGAWSLGTVNLNLRNSGGSNAPLTISGVISGSGNLILSANGSGNSIILSGTNTYTGTTTLTAAGGTYGGSGAITLALGAGGSISNSASLTIVAGTTFDVSAADPFTLSSSTTLIATGTGSVQGTSAAVINDSAPSGVVNLGSQPINLAFAPTNSNGDTNHPSLYISQGALTLGGNTFNVTNVSTNTPLAAGVYSLIQVAGGVITDGEGYAVSVRGVGMVAGASASVQVVGGSVNLVVSGGEPEPIWSNLTASQSNPYGTSSITLSGTLSAPGPVYPSNGETVNVGINGIVRTTTISDGTGDFTLTTNTPTLAPGTYTITYTYPGDASLSPSTNATTALTVTKAPLSITADAETTPYGALYGPLTNSTQFTASATVNGDMVTNVKLTIAGGTPAGTTNAPVGSYSITPSLAAGTLNTNDYAVTYHSNTLSVTAIPLTITAVSKTKNYGTALTFGTVVTSTNNFTGVGFTNGQSVASMTAVLTSSGGAASALPTNYTITPGTYAQHSPSTNFNPNNYSITSVPGTLTVIAPSEIWTGSDATNNSNWSDSTNWATTNAPDAIGDAIDFAGTNGTIPVMDISYTVYSLTFDTNATSFTLTNAGGAALSIGVGVTNNSTNSQYLTMPLVLGVLGATNPIVFNLGASASPVQTVVSGAVSDSGAGLVVMGSNTLSLEGTNTYTGTTLISSGKLEVDGNGQLGNGAYAGNITNNGKFTYASSNTQILSGVVSGLGALNVKGPGTLALAATNTYSGPTTVKGGTLLLTSTGSIPFTSSIDIEGGATFDVSSQMSYALGSATLFANGSNSPATINGAFAGTVNLGSAPLVLGFDGTHPALTIAQGALLLNSNAFTVNAASPLSAGVYPLVVQSNGTVDDISGTFPVPSGTAFGVGTTSFISVSNGSVLLNVRSNTSTVVSSSSTGTNAYLQLVTFSATVTGSDGGGTVAFYEDGSTNPIPGAAAISLVSNVATTPGLSNLTVGFHTISATYSGDTVSTPSSNSLAGGQTVIPANQTITFGALVNQNYGVLPFTVSASASSGLPVSFSILSGPASLSSNLLSVTGAGVVSVVASQPGNSNYNAALPVTNTFTVTLLPQLIQVAQDTNILNNGQTNAINFGTVVQNQPGPIRTFEITNAGSNLLTVIKPILPSGYVLVTNPPASLVSGGAGVFSVQLSSATIGTNAGDIYLTSSDTNHSPFVIPVTGFVTGQVIVLSGDLSFEGVAEHASSNLTLTISNAGNAPLVVSNVTYPNGFSGAFSNVIAAGGSTNVTVTFSPTNASTYGGFMVVHSDATSGDDSIPVSGYGASGSLVLTIVTNGFGKVTADFNLGKPLVSGKKYRLTAVPAKNNVFSNWSGSVAATNANPLVFVMTNSTVIQVNFVTNPFLELKGIFNGLFTNADGVTEESAGMLKNLSVATTGHYTGSLLLDGADHPLAGRFDVAGNATNVLALSKSKGGTLTLVMSLVGSTNASTEVVGTVSNGTGVSTLLALLATNTLPSAEYTMLILPSTNTNNVPPAGSPGGAGYALITNYAGTVHNPAAANAKITGALADGTSFNQTVPVADDGTVPVYANLYGGKGLLLGWINLDLTNSFASSLTWIHPTLPRGLYTNGFTNVLSSEEILLSFWTNAPTNIIGLTNLTLQSNVDAASGVNFAISNSAAGKITGTDIKGTLNLKNGLIKLTLGAKGPLTNAYGVYLESLDVGAGYFTKTNSQGFEISP